MKKITTYESFWRCRQKLELHKNTKEFSCTHSPTYLGKEAAEAIEPTADLESISIEHNRVSEMKGVLEGEGSFPIDGIKDIRFALQQSTIENNILSPRELLNIASTFNQVEI